MANESFIVAGFQGQTVEELRRELQFRFQQLGNRLDELAGKRGTPTFFADVDANTNRVTNLGMPTADSDAQRVDLSLHRPTPSTDFDAQGRKILNIAEGEQDREGVNLAQLRALVADAAATSAPPEVAEASVLGAVTSRFAREDHTHGARLIHYGEISGLNNSTVIGISATGFANRVQVTSFDTNGASSGATPDHTNDHITVDNAGHYLCIATLSCFSDTGTGFTMGFDIEKNNGGSRVAAAYSEVDFAGGGGDAHAISLVGLGNLSVNDTIEVWLWNNTNTTDIVVDTATLSLVRIGN